MWFLFRKGGEKRTQRLLSGSSITKPYPIPPPNPPANRSPCQLFASGPLPHPSLERPVPRGAQSARSFRTPKARPSGGDNCCLQREASWARPREDPDPGPSPSQRALGAPPQLLTLGVPGHLSRESSKSSECGYSEGAWSLLLGMTRGNGPACIEIGRRGLSGRGPAE